MRRQDWAFFASIGAAALAPIAAVGGSFSWAAGWAVLAVAAGAAARRWSREHPGPMPYVMRWVLLVPRGPHTAARLERILEPRAGERILEIGPGVGVHALPIASLLLPNGTLDVLDVQQAMLDELSRKANDAGITNIVAKCTDARTLPYPDHCFDAAYLIGVLGEIRDEAATLRELRRVLKPEGRLVIGEVFVDPDYVALSALKEEAQKAGLVLERRAGPAMAYLARLRPSAAIGHTPQTTS